MLVWRAHAGQPPGHNLATFGHELAEQPVILVVDVGDLLRAELADFLAPEKLASTFTRRTAGPGTPAASASKPRTVSPGTRSVTGRPRRPFGCWRWCFTLFSHNAPLTQWPVVSDQWLVKSFAQELATDHWPLFLSRCRSFRCGCRRRLFCDNRGLRAHLLFRVAQLLDLV